MTITVKDLTGYTESEIEQITAAINSLSSDADEDTRDYFEFDYPDYGGIPDQLAARLTSDQVDYIQDEIGHTKPHKLTILSIAQTLAKGA